MMVSLPPGPRNLITDVPGIAVGQAQDPRLKSGVTVLLGTKPLTAGVHVMGGAPGSRETDLLAPGNLVDRVDALVLSGGSAFGLSSADGVMAGLRQSGRGFPVGERRIPIVPTAILYDLAAGGDHDWHDTPYPTLGATALAAAGDEFDLGSAGAGTGAMAGRLKGGIGSASCRLPDGTALGALVAVNPVGSVAHPETGQFWAAPFEIGSEFGNCGVAPAAATLPLSDLLKSANTTIAIIATDAQLTRAQATRLAIAAHDGMARAILPSHTPFDGDLIFAASTGARPASDPAGQLALGHAAATCLSRAIARGVYHARPAAGDPFPCWQDRYGQA